MLRRIFKFVFNTIYRFDAYFIVCWFAAAAMLVALPNVASAQAGFSVRSADTSLAGNVYVLDTLIDYQLSNQPLEALRKGVPITISLDIEVWRERRYWLSYKIATLAQRYQIQFHALTKHYLVTNLNSGVQSSVPSLQAALDAVGTIVDLPLIDMQLLSSDGSYRVRLRAKLDIDMLPAPLRVLAYVTPSWWLSSDWYSWRLRP